MEVQKQDQDHDEDDNDNVRQDDAKHDKQDDKTTHTTRHITQGNTTQLTTIQDERKPKAMANAHSRQRQKKGYVCER